MKKIALELFGQYRSYILNFEHNLKQLLSQLNNYQIDVYIFSENYNKEKETDIINILKKYNLSIKMIKYYEHIDDIYKQTSKIYQHKFNNNIDTIYGKKYRVEGLKGYHPFTIEYIYRKYLLHKFSKEYFDCDYEFIINARFFDVKFNIIKPFDFLENINNNIYHSVDTFYIAKEHILNDFLLKCVNYKITDMNIPEYRKMLKKYDYNLNGCFPFLSSELITTKILFDNYNNSINIRYNFTAVEISKEPKEEWINYIDIRLCTMRHQNISNIQNIKINKIISAKYGNNDIYIDVIDILKKNLNKQIIIGNKLFNNDPLKNVVKNLIINDEIIVKEGSIIIIYEDI